MNIRLHSNTNLIIHTTDNYDGLPVQTQHGPLIENYLNQFQVTLQNAVDDHPRTCAMRVDLRLPIQEEPTSPRIMSKFFDSLKAQIKADLKKRKKENGRVHPCSVRYIWVKEKNDALKSHYHVLILVNNDCYNSLGRFDKTEGNIAARIKKAWSSALGYHTADIGGLVHFPTNPIYNVNKNSPSFDYDFAELFYRVSYFAKAATKNFGDYSNAFGSSRK
jgi:hypothetical protein